MVDAGVGVCFYQRTNNESGELGNPVLTLQVPSPSQSNNVDENHNYNQNDKDQEVEFIMQTPPTRHYMQSCLPGHVSSSNGRGVEPDTSTDIAIAEMHAPPSSFTVRRRSPEGGEGLDFPCKICARRGETRGPISFSTFDQFEEHYRLYHQV